MSGKTSKCLYLVRYEREGIKQSEILQILGSRDICSAVAKARILLGERRKTDGCSYRIIKVSDSGTIDAF